MGEFRELFRAIDEAFRFLYIYCALIFAIVIIIVFLVVKYVRKKQNKDSAEEKKNVALRVSVYFSLGILFLLLMPLMIIFVK